MTKETLLCVLSIPASGNFYWNLYISFYCIHLNAFRFIFLAASLLSHYYLMHNLLRFCAHFLSSEVIAEISIGAGNNIHFSCLSHFTYVFCVFAHFDCLLPLQCCSCAMMWIFYRFLAAYFNKFPSSGDCSCGRYKDISENKINRSSRKFQRLQHLTALCAVYCVTWKKTSFIKKLRLQLKNLSAFTKLSK